MLQGIRRLSLTSTLTLLGDPGIKMLFPKRAGAKTFSDGAASKKAQENRKKIPELEAFVESRSMLEAPPGESGGTDAAWQ